MISRGRTSIVAAAVVLWVGGWLWLARHYQLDDSLIHLQYAERLWTLGVLSFDGIHRGAGTSSLLFVGLVAILHGMVDSVYIPKVLSLISYLALLGMVALRVTRSSSLARALWLGVLIALLSPMGFRWLYDGMETSLMVLAALVLGLLGHRISMRPTTSARRYLMLVVLGGAVAMLRVELALLIAVATLSALMFRLEQRSRAVGEPGALQVLIRDATRESHLVLGGCVAVLTAHFVTGHFLPDTAVAKATGRASLDQLWGVGRAFMGASSLGLGLLLVWAICLVVVFGSDAVRKAHMRSFLTANSVLALLVALAIVRGQYIHGVRYFLWPLVFMITWDLLVLMPMAPAQATFVAAAPRLKRRYGKFLVAGVMLLVCLWGVEGWAVYKIVEDSSEVFLKMRSGDLKALAGKPGIAFDVGFISYFSQAAICDLSGLVNGRAMALASPEDRLRYCLAQSPSFAYLSPSQAAALGGQINFDSWVLCDEYWLSNVGVREPHYLLVRPELAGMCSGSSLPKWKGKLK